ncbi:hypothetical protein [Clostridium beijerinckii]|uniref:hypothetical protein n=1 Tax=Clostridium beijerinckii TaxID=1520 RepID=UPI001A9BF27A|nr:hypothetical protein [Clostridium beijerinckii]NRT73826.1 hypothetical protein [Clostridium beijerinckii]
MNKKFKIMPLFIILFILPIFPMTSTSDVEIICFLLAMQIIPLAIAVYILTSHFSVYSNKIEVGSVFSKSIVLFNKIKEVDIKLFEGSNKGYNWSALKIIFLDKQNHILCTLPVSNSIPCVISILKNYNYQINISHDLKEYLNGKG